MHYATIYTNSDGARIAFQSSLPITQDEHTNETSPASNETPTTESSKPRKELQQPAQSNPLASKCILLMHGFSGSSEYFVHNYSTLSQHAWIVAPDMRGHGRSQRTKGGYHVARLAADLFDLVRFIKGVRSDVRICPVGCSIGAAVLWTYVEIFGNFSAAAAAATAAVGAVDVVVGAVATSNIEAEAELVSLPSSKNDRKDFNGMVFVDQAPLQDRSKFDNWDETKAHYGLYDEKSLLEAQSTWGSNDATIRREAYRGLVASCLGYRAYPASSDVDKQIISAEQMGEDEKFFSEISAQCDGSWLAKLMADHTRYDHREAIEAINVPVLVMAGRKSGCFPLEGMLETVTRVNHGNGSASVDGKCNDGRVPQLAKASVFECGHWLFYEEPERFNREIVDFVASI